MSVFCSNTLIFAPDLKIFGGGDVGCMLPDPPRNFHELHFGRTFGASFLFLRLFQSFCMYLKPYWKPCLTQYIVLQKRYRKWLI